MLTPGAVATLRLSETEMDPKRMLWHLMYHELLWGEGVFH